MSSADPRELRRIVVGWLRAWTKIPLHQRWGRILICFGVLFTVLDVVRLFVLPPSDQQAFTDIFETVVVLAGALACGFAGARSRNLARGLWAMTAVYLALNAVADLHDFLQDLHVTRANLLQPLELLGWCTYIPLAVLIFFPTTEEGRLKWKWLPVVDFTQVAIAIALAYFRFIYLHEVDLGRGWTVFGQADLVRNVLISAGLLLRGVFEPSVRARPIYRIVGGAFATITLVKGVFPGNEADVSILGRPAALLVIGILAAYWNDRSERAEERTRQADQLRLGLSVLAAATVVVVLLLAYHPPARYRSIIYLTAATSVGLFILRHAVAEYTRYATGKALRKSEDRYRDLVEHSEDLVCTHDLEGRLLSVNPAPARILGYEVAEMLTIPMREMIPPEYRELFDEYLARIRATGSDKGLMVVLTRTGERRTWEYNNTLRTEGVAAPVVRGMAHDVTERRRAELALESSEQKYRLLFEKNVAAVAIASLEGRVLDCNDAWARILGHNAAEEVRGRETTEFYFNPADRASLVDELGREGIFRSREMQLRRKDGTPVWVLFNCALVSAEAGTSLVQTTAIDISDRKQAEEALRRREEDYRRFVTRSSEGIFRQDLDQPVPIDLPEDQIVDRILRGSHLAECNDAIAKMYGLTVNQFVGKRLTETLDPTDPKNIELTREYVRSGFRILERESHEVDIHGNPKVFVRNMIGIVEDGKLLRTWGIQRDVTERVKADEARSKAEKALQMSEAHFRVLVEQSSDGIAIADANGNWIDVNSAATEMLGYTREELLQQKVGANVAAEEVPRVAQELARLHGSETIRSEWKLRRKDGSFFPCEICAKLLPNGRLQIIARDITERRRAEEAMRQSEERFRVALKDSPITVFSQDRELRYTWIYNPQLFWQQEVLGKSDGEIIGRDKIARLEELKRRVIETGAVLREEVQIPHEGKSYAFDITIEPLFDAEGNVVGITGAAMDIARLREMADRLLDARDKLAQEKSYLESEIQAELGFEEIIGQSPALREVLRQARVVAPTGASVLLLGETGTGKELVARAIHKLSARQDKNFIKLNCAAVPSGLLESELFGHEKGAYTSAINQKIGRIELADKGTLFLDEIGELPLELQPKLLRVLQDREFERLGGVRTLRVDVRIIAATNRDLKKDVAEKEFREDLFYRLNVFPLQLPALRDRRKDIPPLIHHFVRRQAARMNKHIVTIPDETVATLQNWNWPGNIRELENLLERMVILSKGEVLAPPPAELEGPQDSPDDNLSEMGREHLIRVLRETSGVLSGADGAASRLGIKRTTLQSMLKRFGIEPRDYRRGTGTFGPE